MVQWRPLEEPLVFNVRRHMAREKGHRIRQFADSSIHPYTESYLPTWSSVLYFDSPLGLWSDWSSPLIMDSEGLGAMDVGWRSLLGVRVGIKIKGTAMLVGFFGHGSCMSGGWWLHSNLFLLLHLANGPSMSHSLSQWFSSAAHAQVFDFHMKSSFFPPRISNIWLTKSWLQSQILFVSFFPIFLTFYQVASVCQILYRCLVGCRLRRWEYFARKRQIRIMQTTSPFCLIHFTFFSSYRWYLYVQEKAWLGRKKREWRFKAEGKEDRRGPHPWQRNYGG